MGDFFKPIVRSIPYDSPSSIFKKIYHAPPAFLLESGRETGKIGRYSFIGTNPYLTVEFKDSQWTTEKSGKTQKSLAKDPFVYLRQLLKDYRVKMPPSLPPFFGGAVGYFGYEIVRHFEKLPELKKNSEDFPDIFLLFVDTIIAIDHLARTTDIIYTPAPEELAGCEWNVLRRRGEEKISFYLEKLSEKSHKNDELPPYLPKRTSGVVPSLTKDHFENMVLQCQEYIKSGDIFQANLSQRFKFSRTEIPSLSIYERLQKINPSPFSSFLDGGNFQIVSSSPERLIKLSKNILSTRPIAGTRPRGTTLREDELMRLSLISNEKERAEHMMLIDLERNDMGKICQYGTVQVDEFMGIENYSHVIHIVSNIIGKIKPDCGWYEVLKALFPGGTITGVPKVRAMEIIEQLEVDKRGPYTGSLGYISFSGDLDFNILIRTLFLNEKIGFIQTGAGIVADSIPEKEFEETLQKAEALFKAVWDSE